jgi:phenylacetate-CoA ligase
MLQLARLQAMVDWAHARSPFWRRKLDAAKLRPGAIQSLEDIRRLPFLTKSELLAEQAEHPPYGELLTAPAGAGIAYHQTSGTIGATPFRVVESPRDWAWGANAWARALYAFGLRSTDVVYLPFGYGPFIGFWGAHYAIQRIGATTVPGGNQSSEARIRQIMDVGATAIVATPSYAIRLSQVAAEMGVDLPRETRVELGIHAGEPGGSIPATKRLLEGRWGYHAGDFLGMTETAGITAYECTEKSGLHVSEDYFLEEVLDKDSGEPVRAGELGERVCTSFAIGLIPIIRYRTGDLVRRVPGAECPCGRTFDLYQGGVVGRADDMLWIKGTNVFPSAIEGVVRLYPEIREFMIVLTGVRLTSDEIMVQIELDPQTAPDVAQPLVGRLRSHLAEACEGLRFGVQLVPEKTLPTFELKARRVLDQRKEA